MGISHLTIIFSSILHHLKESLHVPRTNTDHQEHRQFCFRTTSSLFTKHSDCRIKTKSSHTVSDALHHHPPPSTPPQSLFTVDYMPHRHQIIFITLLIQSTYRETRVKTPGTFFFPQPRAGIITPSRTQHSWVIQASGPP